MLPAAQPLREMVVVSALLTSLPHSCIASTVGLPYIKTNIFLWRHPAILIDVGNLILTSFSSNFLAVPHLQSRRYDGSSGSPFFLLISTRRVVFQRARNTLALYIFSNNSDEDRRQHFTEDSVGAYPILHRPDCQLQLFCCKKKEIIEFSQNRSRLSLGG